jgi:hypothetical protein
MGGFGTGLAVPAVGPSETVFTTEAQRAQRTVIEILCALCASVVWNPPAPGAPLFRKDITGW